MTAVCIAAIICAFMAFVVWCAKDNDRPSEPRPPEDDFPQPEPERPKHCFHPEDGEPKNQLCCYCGQSRLSPRPINGHGERFKQETDIVNETCYRRSWIQ